MLDVLLNTLIVVLILGVLVSVHEFGHLLAAKLVGAKVLEFAIGMGPRLLSKKIKGIDCSIRIFPIGGYVRILGENIEDGHEDSKLNLRNKTWYQKVFVMIAGVTMNLILTFVFYTIILTSVGFVINLPEQYKDFSPFLGEKRVVTIDGGLKYSEVVDDTPAKKANVPASGVISEINGEKVYSSLRFREVMKENGSKTVNVIICSKKCLQYSITPNEKGKLGIMVESNSYVEIDYSKNKVLSGIGHTVNYTRLIVDRLGEIFSQAKATNDYSTVVNGVSGPVGLYLVVDQLKGFGVLAILELTASLSLSLAVMNVLPIPALDGGRILLVLIEVIIRRKLNAKLENAVISISYILLLVLIAAIMIKDIVFFKDLSELVKQFK